VSIDLSEHIAGFHGVRGAIDELRACYGDCELFFADVFQELDSLSAELGARAQQVAQAAPHTAPRSTAVDLHHQHLQEQMQQMSQRQTQLEQERAELTSELGIVRQRAAHLGESVAEQKRLLARQQAFWAGELKHMRLLLEGMSHQIGQTMPAEDARPS
jgi:uncharacterized protein (DUF3084 family)